MHMKDFNKIVKILWRKWWKVLLKKEIFEIIDPECKSEYRQFVDKTIYRLRAEEYIIPLKAGVYIVPDSEDRNLNSVDLLEKYYLQLLKKYITQHVGSSYYISWLKSLQFHMKDYSLPERIYVMNRSLSKKIKVGNYEIIFKTLSGKQQGKKINLFSKFSTYSKEISVTGIKLKASGLELALLESALVTDTYEWLNIDILTRVVKKYGKVLDYSIFQEIGRYKYNMSVNRLKELTRTLDPKLSQLFLDIIKRNGGCFVGEGLRGI